MGLKKQDVEKISEMIRCLPFRTRAIEFWQKLDAMGMTFMQSQVLRFVSRNEGCLMKDLAREFSVTLADITGIADRLEGKGLLKRTPDPRDRRASRLILTPRARSLAKRMDAVKQKTMAEVLERLTDRERKKVMDGFEIFLRASGDYLTRHHG